MKNYRLFLNGNRNTQKNTISFTSDKRSEKGKTHVAMFSCFFSSIPKDMFCTNGMYEKFLGEIVAAVGIYRPKDEIIIDIYEKEPSSEEIREIALLGFRRYVRALHSKQRKQFLEELTTVSFFALLGIIFEFIAFYYDETFRDWVLFIFETTGSVLLWQFVGYWAFEYAWQRREIKKLKWIGEMEYRFIKWE